MDRKRDYAALAGLGEVQRLQIAAARAELGDAMNALGAAGEATEASWRQLRMSERDFEDTLAAASFDPDAMRRAGLTILIAEDQLTERREVERRAEQSEATARAEWHGHRLRSRAIDGKQRQLHRKLVQAAEDKAAVDIMALAASRNVVP